MEPATTCVSPRSRPRSSLPVRLTGRLHPTIGLDLETPRLCARDDVHVQGTTGPRVEVRPDRDAGTMLGEALLQHGAADSPVVGGDGERRTTVLGIGDGTA